MWKVSAFVGFLCAVALCGPASAVDAPRAAEFGPTLPPVGYVKFCATSPDECKPHGGIRGKGLSLSPERWQTLYQINTMVNTRIKPMSDQDLYGEPERWALPRNAGDCEDYLLLKKKYLEALGFPAAALLVTVVLDERREGHAVLTVVAEDGDYVLDNRRNDILRWNSTGYNFLKRQSQGDPRKWVALMAQPAAAVLSATQSD